MSLQKYYNQIFIMKTTILTLFIALIIYLNSMHYIKVNHSVLFVIIFIAVISTCYNFDIEHFNHSNEIQSLSNAYNTGNAIVKNLRVTGTLDTYGRTQIGNDMTVDNGLTARYGTVREVFNQIPRGVVVEWANDVAPIGWAICDGNNGTPDLRGRFIIGRGQGSHLSNYNLNDIGGSEQVTLTIAQLPAHTHGIGGGIRSDMTGSGYRDNLYRSRTGYTSHSAGGNQPHENRPPYYALTYIMKL